MSYILDALKKSEKEKTLGQVPTLASVVSDGAKKQRTGTPWWLNVVVFFVALLAVVAILKMAGLLEFSRSSDTAADQSLQPEPEAQTVANASMSEFTSGSATESQANQNVSITQDEQSMASEQQSEAQQTQAIETEAIENQSIDNQDLQSQDSLTLADTQIQDDVPLSNDEPIQDQALADIDDIPTAQEIEEKFAAQEAEEIAALAQQLEAQQVQTQQQSDQANSNNTNANEQSSQSDYEDVIHNDLRDTSVNVVSYSSDARQRFVMLDLTIFKEGDQLANKAKVIEIIRTGAIVEYQNKRYLLKP